MSTVRADTLAQVTEDLTKNKVLDIRWHKQMAAQSEWIKVAQRLVRM